MSRHHELIFNKRVGASNSMMNSSVDSNTYGTTIHDAFSELVYDKKRPVFCCHWHDAVKSDKPTKNVLISTRLALAFASVHVV